MDSFEQLQLSPEILRSITELGFTKPSPIQAEALPLLLGEATDFLGLAATGTGKTAAFGIPMLERIDTGVRAIQALILCPTRELALQVSGQINLIGKYKGVRSVAVYGGASYGDQIRGLRAGAQIVVGTPGRLVDHMQRGTITLDQLHTVILDEADEMISMGFKDDLEFILGSTPRESSNIWLFSATMSREVRRVADEYLRDPAQVQINRTEMLPTTVEQFYYVTSESNKPEILCKLIDAADDFYGLVFCQTKQLVADLTNYLSERGYKVDSLHGDKDQNARERTMQAFRTRKVSLLICTDVASRGLDVKDITHVINYSIPRELDNYVHRIGRTARSGKTGIAMSLVTPSNRSLVIRIERMTKSRMYEGKVPTRKEIGMKKVSKILARFQEQTGADRAISLLDMEWKKALTSMSSEEVAGRFLAMTYPDVFSEQREAPAPARTGNEGRPAAIVLPTSSAAAPAYVRPTSSKSISLPKPVLNSAAGKAIAPAPSRFEAKPAASLDAFIGGPVITKKAAHVEIDEDEMEEDELDSIDMEMAAIIAETPKPAFDAIVTPPAASVEAAPMIKKAKSAKKDKAPAAVVLPKIAAAVVAAPALAVKTRKAAVAVAPLDVKIAPKKKAAFGRPQRDDAFPRTSPKWEAPLTRKKREPEFGGFGPKKAKGDRPTPWGARKSEKPAARFGKPAGKPAAKSSTGPSTDFFSKRQRDFQGSF